MKKCEGVSDWLFVLVFGIVAVLAGFAAFGVAREAAFCVPTAYAEPLLIEMQAQTISDADAFQTASLSADDLMAKKEAEARAAEIEALKGYEQADFDFMRGVVYEPTSD